MNIQHGADKNFTLSDQLKDVETRGGYHKGKYVLPKLFESLSLKKNCRILDVGTGIGYVLKGLEDSGYKNILGLEPGGRVNDSPFDYVLDIHTSEFLKKFPDRKFDIVMSFGVIEHVGTVDGHSMLAEDYSAIRDKFYKDCLDLIDENGFLLVFGPNRLFPFDIQHGPANYGPLRKIKKYLPFLRMLTIPFHSENFLVSWDDVDKSCNKISSENNFSIAPYYLKQNGLVAGFGRKNKFILNLFRAYTHLIDRLNKNVAKYFHTHTLYICQKKIR